MSLSMYRRPDGRLGSTMAMGGMLRPSKSAQRRTNRGEYGIAEGAMAFGMLFGFSERLWDTLVLLFVFIPLTLIWVLTLVHIFRRVDLTRMWKIVWVVAVVLFPLVGIVAYWMRRPRVVVADQPSASTTTTIADAVDSVSVVL